MMCGARIERGRQYDTSPQRNTPDEPAGAISAGGTVLSFYEREFLTQLGERVRALRSLRDMSRRELPRQSGISERYIARIEAGRGNVSIVLLPRLALAIRDESMIRTRRAALAQSVKRFSLATSA